MGTYTCHDHCDCTAAPGRIPGGEGYDRWQLFCLQLSTVLLLETGTRAGSHGGAGPGPGGGNTTGGLPAHPFLPETLPFLLFQGIHRQRFHGD